MSKEETLSTSTKEIPKHKNALEEKYKENKVEEKDLSKTEEHKLPKPTGWRMLVLPFKMKDKTKGGIYLGEAIS